MEKITIREIAKIAGVSRGTVDKVLHDREGVSDDVRQKVQNIIDDLDYKPNLAGKALNMLKAPKKISVVLPDGNNPFFVSMQQGMADQFTRFQNFGLNIDYFYYHPQDVKELIQIINTIDESTDGLIIRGLENKNLTQAIMKWSKKDRQVILIDSDISNVDKLCLIGEDCKMSGRMAGSLMTKTKKQGKVAIISGSREVNTHNQRISGFKSVLEEYNDLEILDVFYTNEDKYLMKEIVKNLFSSYDNLAGIFNVAGHSDVLAKQLVKYNLAKEITYICYNSTESNIKMLKDGVIDYILDVSPYRQGSLAVECLFDYWFRNIIPKQVIETPINILIDENIK